MARHVFGAIVTGLGVASNNRGLTEGNTTTLQKIVWRNSVHSTISSEAIRFSLRRQLDNCNRNWDEATRKNTWRDADFLRWSKDSKEEVFADDDLLGFMRADAAKEEADDSEQEDEAGDAKKAKPKKNDAKGTIKVRRGVLEISRAVSLTPWAGDATFNAASPAASPAAAKKGDNPVPYAAEMHATYYQYGFSMTPDSLRVKSRAGDAIKAIASLGPVAGNHGRFLFDFSPESIVFRISEEPSPRILNCFDLHNGEIIADELVRKIQSGDVKASEVIVGGKIAKKLAILVGDTRCFPGVVAAAEKACDLLLGSA